MTSELNNYIYPTACNPCILRCALENGKEISTLYMEHTFDTIYVQLAFTENMYKEDETLFHCDYMEAKDGGLPFLIVLDIIKSGSKDFKSFNYNIRLELAKSILEDPFFFDINSYANEYRVRLPLLFNLNQINEVFTHIIPNMYGVAHGVAFTKDGFREQVKTNDNNFLIRKTKLPEVYELYIDGMTPVPGNNIAYIPSLELSKRLRDLLSTRNSTRIRCIMHEKRQKWIPVV